MDSDFSKDCAHCCREWVGWCKVYAGRSVSAWWVVEEEINRNIFECFLGNKLGHGNESDPGLEEK